MKTHATVGGDVLRDVPAAFWAVEETSVVTAREYSDEKFLAENPATE